jgi:hypothetical protein
MMLGRDKVDLRKPIKREVFVGERRVFVAKLPLQPLGHFIVCRRVYAPSNNGRRVQAERGPSFDYVVSFDFGLDAKAWVRRRLCNTINLNIYFFFFYQ